MDGNSDDNKLVNSIENIFKRLYQNFKVVWSLSYFTGVDGEDQVKSPNYFFQSRAPAGPKG